MSDDEDDLQMDFSLDQSGTEDVTGFGPLNLTVSERSLMERVRQELKIELKQVPGPIHSIYITSSGSSSWFAVGRDSGRGSRT